MRVWVVLSMSLLGLSACRPDDGDGGEGSASETDGDGDGGECSGTPIAPEQLADVYAEFLCGLFACQDYCPKLDAYGGQAACEAAIAAEYTSLFDQLEQAGVGYDALCAGGMATFIQSYDQCNLPDGTEQPDCYCDPFPGSAGLGDACMQQEFESMLWTGGTYVIDDCQPDLYCDPDCGVCIGFNLDEGQACGGNCGGYCGAGLSCVEGTCTPRASEGDPCVSPFDCQDGLYCEEDLCAPAKAEGSDCLVGYECQEGLICDEGLCSPPKAVGQPCSTNSDCQDGLYCPDATCEAQKSSGAACTENSECEAGVCDDDGRCTDYLCTL